MSATSQAILKRWNYFHNPKIIFKRKLPIITLKSIILHNPLKKKTT